MEQNINAPCNSYFTGPDLWLIGRAFGNGLNAAKGNKIALPNYKFRKSIHGLRPSNKTRVLPIIPNA